MSLVALSFPKTVEMMYLQTPPIGSIEKLVYSLWFLAKYFSAVIEDSPGALLSGSLHHFYSQSRVPMSSQGVFHCFDPSSVYQPDSCF